MLRQGTIVDGRYRILEQIGFGGTSNVYLAENIRLHNKWAIKELFKNSISATGHRGNGLVVETSILTRLDHPGLPSIIDIIETPTAYLIVMEYIKGESLDKLVNRVGFQTERDVISWAMQLCDVLTYLHAQNPPIIHRDMKPANIIRKPDGSIVLIDFGIAREFKRSNIRDTDNLGTRGYAAPEQYDATQQSDERTDIYGLGVTMYHLLTNHDPCSPPYGMQRVRDIRPGLSSSIEAIIEKCIQHRPEERYQTAQELKRALGMAASGTTEFLSPEPEDEPNNSYGWVLGGCGAVVALALLVAVALAAGGTDARRDPTPLQRISAIVERFMAEEDYSELYYEDTVTITEPDERIELFFVPEVSGYYWLYSSSADNILPLAWLSDEKGNVIGQDNTSGDYSEFEMRCWMESGKEYTIQTTIYDLNSDYDQTGTFRICLEYDGT